MSQDQHLQFLIKSHSATLEKLVSSDHSATLQLPALPHLKDLSCGLLNDMTQLLQCPKLTSITIIGAPEDIDYHALLRAKSFLRQATQLETVYLRSVVVATDEDALDIGLVQALAESGQSAVKSLYLEVLDRPDGQVLGPYADLMQLTDALSRLPYLEWLDLDVVAPHAFLRALSTAICPRLTHLGLRAPRGCYHSWVHGPTVQYLLRRNSRLHLMIDTMKSELCPAADMCEWCVWGCHADLRQPPADDRITAFASHSKQDDCSVNSEVHCIQV